MAVDRGASEPLLHGGDEEQGEAPVKVTWLTETKYLIGLSAPAILQLCGQQGLVVTNQVG